MVKKIAFLLLSAVLLSGCWNKKDEEPRQVKVVEVTEANVATFQCPNSLYNLELPPRPDYVGKRLTMADKDNHGKVGKYTHASLQQALQHIEVLENLILGTKNACPIQTNPPE